MSPHQEVDQEVRRRQRDQQLDLRQHQGVPHGQCLVVCVNHPGKTSWLVSIWSRILFYSIAFHHCNLRCNAMLQIRPKCQLWSDSADAFLRISKYRVTFQCGATIEKDGGCNHMICKNQSCKVRQISPKFLPIQTSRLTSVGCALDPGSHMVALGTTAIGKREHWRTFSTNDIRHLQVRWGRSQE